MTVLFAMDRALTVRAFDADGRLRVATANISKANVCPYYGREIPGWQELGLDGDRIYQMLRHPDELAKAADTFNNLPVLSEHVPVSAASHRPELVVGSTGSHAAFDGDYLSNNLIVWARDSIDGIVCDRKRELSSAYRYTPDMTPGNYRGSAYDGIMRNIEGNHVALVIKGRAGPDVYVGDEHMKTRTALMVSGALAALVRPKLAADAKLDLTPLLDDVSAKSIAMDNDLPARIVAAVKPVLAADQELTEQDVKDTLATVPAVEKDDDLAPGADPAKPGGPEPVPAKIAEPAPAMDAAVVQTMVDKARTDALAEAAAIRTAEREVRPFVGEVIAQDSAAKVYQIALDQQKVDLTGVPESAYGAILRALPKPSDRAAPVVADRSGPSRLDAIAPKRTILVN